MPCQWECKLVQLLWKTAWRFLKKLKIERPYDPGIPLLGKYREKNLNSEIEYLVFLWIYAQISGPYGGSIFRFLRNFHTVLHSGCINLHPYQQHKRVSFSPYPLQHLLFVGVLMIFILTGCKVVSHCSFDLHFSNN